MSHYIQLKPYIYYWIVFFFVFSELFFRYLLQSADCVPLWPDAVVSGANLKGVDMEGSQMTGINLRVATLKNAKLKNCNLRGATLAGTDLEVSASCHNLTLAHSPGTRRIKPHVWLKCFIDQCTFNSLKHFIPQTCSDKQ